MTRKISRARRQHPAQPTSHVYLPHSSWSRVERSHAAVAPLEPDDFWARLGL